MSFETRRRDENWTVCSRRAGASAREASALFCSASRNWSQEAYDDALDLHSRLESCTDSYVAPLIRDSLRTLGHAYRLYGPCSVVGSFNGGKDAVALVHLMRAAAAHFLATTGDRDRDRDRDQDGRPRRRPRPQVIYFEHADEFPEVLELLRDTVNNCDLDMVSFEVGIGYAEGLRLLVETNRPEGPDDSSGGGGKKGTPIASEDLKEQQDRRQVPPHPISFILGTRTGDPNAGSQGTFAPSSHWMPPFMRINPIISWTYGNIWHVLRLFRLPYCSLYDRGYTSLGSTKDTLPCPALAKPMRTMRKRDISCEGADSDCDRDDDGNCDGDGDGEYWPAYMLRDWDQERAGRMNAKEDRNEQIQPAGGHIMSASSSTVSLVDEAVEREEEEKEVFTRVVGLVVIGDEVLKGLVKDANTHAAAAALRENRVPLSRVSIVSDDTDEISAEINRMQSLCDVVITSGGVGPTHDDVTVSSVANALGEGVVLNKDMLELLVRKLKGSSEDAALMKMAMLPRSARLVYLTDDAEEWPVLECRNVFILPGVPTFFSEKVKALAQHLLASEIQRAQVYRIILACDEAMIVGCLNKAVKRNPAVSFGSYPFVDHPDCKTVLTLEARPIEGGYCMHSGVTLTSEKTRRQSVPSNKDIFYSKEDMEKNVEVALSDILSVLPPIAVLRVDNTDSLLLHA